MIGPSIVDAAVQAGVRVRVLTRRTAPPTDGWPWNSVDDQVEVVSGDVRDTPTLRTSMRGVEVVIHAAGLAHRRPDSRSAMEELVDANVGGARSVAAAANAEGVRRVVLISSASVYGSGSDGARDETTPTRPTTAYGRSKLESERVMGAILGDALTVLRVCAVSGPRLRGQYATLLDVVRSRWPIPVIEGHGHCLISDHDLADVVTRTALDPDAGGADPQRVGWSPLLGRSDRRSDLPRDRYPPVALADRAGSVRHGGTPPARLVWGKRVDATPTSQTDAGVASVRPRARCRSVAIVCSRTGNPRRSSTDGRNVTTLQRSAGRPAGEGRSPQVCATWPGRRGSRRSATRRGAR